MRTLILVVSLLATAGSALAINVSDAGSDHGNADLSSVGGPSLGIDANRYTGASDWSGTSVSHGTFVHVVDYATWQSQGTGAGAGAWQGGPFLFGGAHAGTGGSYGNAAASSGGFVDTGGSAAVGGGVGTSTASVSGSANVNPGSAAANAYADEWAITGDHAHVFATHNLGPAGWRDACVQENVSSTNACSIGPLP